MREMILALCIVSVLNTVTIVIALNGIAKELKKKQGKETT